MLKLRNLAYRPWPVTISFQECGADGELVEQRQRCIGHFAPFDEARIAALRTEIFGAGTDAELAAAAEARPVEAQAALDARLIGALVVGWEAVADADGAPVTFTAERLQALLTGPDGPAFRRGFHAAILEIRFGIAPAKNAVTSPAPGPTPAAGEAATS